ncbi:predicted protein [Lichtheimia corymbifera JMRC:FSU:9682]|uniref:Uncharacterized protein n=1 Tax=Lichtheimia corymbifera JMRC:FSU:9682 TaxID=1263082 RepID=A0A068RYJ7_9FUNG|nr:predicted protein [Lichtheimia corymbifera JMRC:FSU:9682]
MVNKEKYNGFLFLPDIVHTYSTPRICQPLGIPNNCVVITFTALVPHLYTHLSTPHSIFIFETHAKV